MGLKNLFSEFKAFAFKGNMIDLAVAVVIGAAFSGVIGSLVKDIVMPTIFMATSAVKEAKDVAVTGVEKAAETAKKAAGIAASQPATEPTSQPTTQPAEAAVVPPAGAVGAVGTAATGGAPVKEEPKKEDPKKVVDFDWKIGQINIGAFVAELLNFIIVAFAVFIIIVKMLGSVMKKVGGTPKPEEPTTRECPECLSIIPIKAKRCAHCTAVVTPIGSTTGAS